MYLSPYLDSFPTPIYMSRRDLRKIHLWMILWLRNEFEPQLNQRVTVNGDISHTDLAKQLIWITVLDPKRSLGLGKTRQYSGEPWTISHQSSLWLWRISGDYVVSAHWAAVIGHSKVMACVRVNEHLSLLQWPFFINCPLVSTNSTTILLKLPTWADQTKCLKLGF